jgi:hypothetical protein
VLCVKKSFNRKERKVKPRKERKEKAVDFFLPLIRIANITKREQASYPRTHTKPGERIVCSCDLVDRPPTLSLQFGIKV